jgi:hypothetical protein
LNQLEIKKKYSNNMDPTAQNKGAFPHLAHPGMRLFQDDEEMDQVYPPNFLQSRHKKLQSEISEMGSSEMQDQVCDFGSLLKI